MEDEARRNKFAGKLGIEACAHVKTHFVKKRSLAVKFLVPSHDCDVQFRVVGADEQKLARTAAGII